MHIAQSLINRVALVLDASGSMLDHEDAVIKAADAQVEHLARRSKDLGQETRLTVYRFDVTTECLIFDMDVLRVPSMAGLYQVGRTQTALINATMQAVEDLEQTSTLYGDHAFLIYTFTDGLENASYRFGARHTPSDLRRRLNALPENWTAAALVPNVIARKEAVDFGFPAGNVALWDTGSADGFEQAMDSVRAATDTYMTDRARGVRGSRTIFSTGPDAVNQRTVSALDPMPVDKFKVVPTAAYEGRMDEFVKRLGLPYVVGGSFYQFTKREEIQPQKRIVIVNKHTGLAYHDGNTVSGVGSPRVRDMIGLPHTRERVSPNHNPDFTIYVQSTAPNRKVLAGTSVMVLL